jgi:hypothetical protein
MEIISKLCRKCGKEKPINKFRIRQGVNGLIVDHKCVACRARMLCAQLKLQMLEAFGWKCSCCGVEHPYFLTLEHINGGRHFYGKRFGREGKQYQQSNTYAEMARAKRDKWDRTQWECLCSNCNSAKAHYGQCPHRTGVTKEQVIESLKRDAAGIGYEHRNPRGLGTFKDGFDARRTGNPHIASQPRDWHGRLTKREVSETLTGIEKASE